MSDGAGTVGCGCPNSEKQTTYSARTAARPTE